MKSEEINVILDNLDAVWRAEADQRDENKIDRMFAYSPRGQFTNDLRQKIGKDRVLFSSNIISKEILEIQSEYRRNRIIADFRPISGGQFERLSETADMVYRADHMMSAGREAFETAFDEMISGGFGAWRLHYSIGEGGREMISTSPIHEADQKVFFDPNAILADKSDAQWCFVVTTMTRSAFESEFGSDAVPSTEGRSSRIGSEVYPWISSDRDLVSVAEYYEIGEGEQETVRVVSNGVAGEELWATAANLAWAKQFEGVPGYHVVYGSTKRNVVSKTILSGSNVLRERETIPGEFIPIVPVFCYRTYLDGIEHSFGVVRNVRDPITTRNLLISLLTEGALASPFRKPIMTAEQIAGHEETWKVWGGDKNYAVAIINPVEGPNGEPQYAGPVGWIEPPALPQGTAALLQTTAQDIQEMIGGSVREIVSNVSGDAIARVNERADRHSGVIMANFARGVAHSGRIWLSMAHDLYTDPEMKLMAAADGNSHNYISVGDTEMINGVEVQIGNLSATKMSVLPSVGPSNSTQREEVRRGLMDAIQVAQSEDTRAVLEAMLINNIEGTGMEELREFARKKLVALGVMEPSQEDLEKEAARAQNAEPQETAEEKYLEASAAKAAADAVRSEADTELKVARTEKTKAETENLRGRAL